MEPEARPEGWDIPIEELQLAVPAYNILKRAQINTIADLQTFTDEELRKLNGLGDKTFRHLKRQMKARFPDIFGS